MNVLEALVALEQELRESVVMETERVTKQFPDVTLEWVARCSHRAQAFQAVADRVACLRIRIETGNQASTEVLGSVPSEAQK